MHPLYRVLRFIARALAFVIFPYKIIGREKIPKTGPLILCANHVSFIDPVWLGIAVKNRQIYFMAKEELFEIKVLGGIIRRLGAFPVKRGGSDVDAMKFGYEVLQKGNIMGIFPEGTRSKTGKLGRAKAGAAVIAHKSQTNILPVAIVLPGQRVKPFRRVKIVVGDVIAYDSLGISDDAGLKAYREAGAKLMQPIAKMIEENKTHAN